LVVIQAAACDVTSGETGNMRPLDEPSTRKLPVGLEAPGADEPDAYYRHSYITTAYVYAKVSRTSHSKLLVNYLILDPALKLIKPTCSTLSGLFTNYGANSNGGYK